MQRKITRSSAVWNLSGVHTERRRREPGRSGYSWKTEDSQAQRASAVFRVAGSVRRLKVTTSVCQRSVEFGELVTMICYHATETRSTGLEPVTQGLEISKVRGTPVK